MLRDYPVFRFQTVYKPVVPFHILHIPIALVLILSHKDVSTLANLNGF